MHNISTERSNNTSRYYYYIFDLQLFFLFDIDNTPYAYNLLLLLYKLLISLITHTHNVTSYSTFSARSYYLQCVRTHIIPTVII